MPAEYASIASLAGALETGEVTAEAIVDGCLNAIAERDSTINAFITVLADDAREAARVADREIAAGRYRGPLHGVPISVKDLFDIRGTATTAASRVRADHRAAADAVSVARLREAGAIIVG